MKLPGGKAALRRRAVPIHAYVGPNGGGKSLAMVHDTLDSLRAGRTVLSTVRLLDWEGIGDAPTTPQAAAGVPAVHPAYVEFSDFRQLLDAEHCDVLMDEVTGVASSRESQSMPVQVANFLVQLRRRDVVLRWTSPNFARADKIMREVTQAVTYCRGHMPERVQDGRLWRSRRLFLWRTYDALAFDEFTAHKRESLKSEARQLFWRPGSAAEAAYNTLDSVTMLGTASEAGLCMVCGGRRAHPKCGCAPGSTLDLLDQLDAEHGTELAAGGRTGRRSRSGRVPGAPLVSPVNDTV